MHPLPGVLYRLPKIHKPNFCTNYQFYPIFPAYNAPTFNIAKFLVPILSHVTVNSHTVSNSCSFVKDIAGISDASNYCMVSYDIESLFTNIPLSETIEISLNKFCLLMRPTNSYWYRKTLEVLTFFTYYLEPSVCWNIFC